MRRMLACLAALAAAPAASEPCRLALALALDVSGSVDRAEYRLRAEGLAQALNEPDVRDAFYALPRAPVAVVVYRWSASRYQRLIQDWVLVKDEAARLSTRARARA